MNCPECGFEHPVIAKFCMNCGHHLPLDARPASPLVTAKTAPTEPAHYGWFIGGAALLAALFVGVAALLDQQSRVQSPTSTDRWSYTAAPAATIEYILAAPASGITMANYERLQTGMTYSQAVAILGSPGTELSRSDLAGYATVMYQWQGSGLGNMNAMFQNGRLIQKAQFGLK